MLSNNRLKAHKLTHWQAFVTAKKKAFPLPPRKSIPFSSLEHRGSNGSFSKCFESYCNIFHEADSILTVLIATEHWCIYNTWALPGPQSTKPEQIHSRTWKIQLPMAGEQHRPEHSWHICRRAEQTCILPFRANSTHTQNAALIIPSSPLKSWDLISLRRGVKLGAHQHQDKPPAFSTVQFVSRLMRGNLDRALFLFVCFQPRGTENWPRSGVREEG